MTDMNIPTIDLADLAAGGARRDSAAAEIRRAFSQFGLAYVRGHNVLPAELLRLYAQFREFATNPMPVKERYARSDLWFQRGYTPPNTEVAVASGGQPDFKECYFAAPYDNDPGLALRFPELYPANIWPEEAPAGFREAYIALGRALHEAGALLLEGAAHSLGLGPDTFTGVLKNGAHVTRLLNYLGLTPEQIGSNVLWGEEHTDFNLLTLLPGGQFYNPSGALSAKPDDNSGLFLRTRGTPENPGGTLVRGRAPEGCITVQVGQQLEILTAGAFLATPHVITAPGAANWTRMSSAHFMHMRADAVLYPLQEFLTAAAMKNYGPPVLAGTYSLKTLVDIGLAPKAALEQLGYRHYDRLDTQRATAK
jgi:isopenicillin N synthase-like dioxygenase